MLFGWVIKLFGWVTLLAPGSVDLHFLVPNLAYMQYSSHHDGLRRKMSDFAAIRAATAYPLNNTSPSTPSLNHMSQYPEIVDTLSHRFK
jgi:hypothetical protein